MAGSWGRVPQSAGWRFWGVTVFWVGLCVAVVAVVVAVSR